jgi:hypothetical protein
MLLLSLSRLLLLSIGDVEPWQKDGCKGEQVLSLLSDMARRPSQHLGDHNALVIRFL